ncbi:universal stress protein [Hyalangium versicolor]|uniref:universal stress protein n=1 Tax=Hyalangium versicolor TaxID=2861190 RepID=UPI001CCE8D59|nr:universal stress protein [Hyalangium versicolor]
MSVICVTNLTPHSVRAGTAAAAVAARLGEPLALHGVVEHEGSGAGGLQAEAPLSERLEAEAERLRGLGAEVRTVLHSRLDEVISDAECRQARWLVVASEGWGASAWRRGPLPERIVRRACAPVLVVRNDGALVEWARGRRRLTVMVGVDTSEGGGGPSAFLRSLREVGPCDIIAAYVCSPPEERERLGIHTPVRVELLDPVVRGIQALDPQVEHVLLREVRERVGELPGEGQVEIHLEPGYGRRADHLLHVARERSVDLLVVGTHQRAGLQRWWHGSVSEGVLRQAEQSVVCVPPQPVRARPALPPRTVVVPVDFSEGSLRAIAQARSLVAEGGRIHLLHVHERRLGDPDWTDHYGVLPEPPGEHQEVLRRLEALVPEGELAVRWSVEGVSASDMALAVCQAAEREGADMVCVAASESRLGHVGGVARELMARCHRPVMVVPSAAPSREPRGWAPEPIHPG